MKLDPRTKLVIVFSFSTLAVVVQDVYLLGFVLLVTTATANYFKGDWGFMKRARKFIVLFVGIALLQSIFAPAGPPLITLGDFTLLTQGGLTKGVRVIVRMLVIIISATIMKGCSAREIIQGLVQWKVPYEIAFMVSLAIRFLPILGQEAKDAYTAIQLRGIEIEELTLRQRLKLYSYLFMPVLAGVVYRARELSTSLKARAFRAYPERTSFIRLKLTRTDYAIMLTSLTFAAAVMLIYF